MAGFEPANQVNPVVADAMREAGIDITGNTPHLLETDASAPAMSSSPWAAATPAPSSRATLRRLGTHRSRRPTLDVVRQVRDDIRARVEKLIAELTGP